MSIIDRVEGVWIKIKMLRDALFKKLLFADIMEGREEERERNGWSTTILAGSAPKGRQITETTPDCGITQSRVSTT